MKDVLRLALLDEKVDHPINFAKKSETTSKKGA